MSRCNVESTGPPLQTMSFNVVHQQPQIYEAGHKKRPPKHLNLCMLMSCSMRGTNNGEGHPGLGINWPPGLCIEPRQPKASRPFYQNFKFGSHFSFSTWKICIWFCILLCRFSFKSLIYILSNVYTCTLIIIDRYYETV